MSIASSQPSLSPLRGAVRGLATLLGRWALGEPVAVLSRRSVERLTELEWRERMRQAERDGDHATLDAELARVQLTDADLARLSTRDTPLIDWPDEDVEAMFGPPRLGQPSVESTLPEPIQHVK